MKLGEYIIKIFNKNKLFYIISIGFCMIFIVIFLSINKSNIKNKISFIFNNFFMTLVETDEYKSSFDETLYKNYRILHKNDLKPALPLLLMYLDKLELQSESLLGYTPLEKLTLQIDYDENIFRKRNSTVSTIDNLAGYYDTETKTIYMYVDDVYRDIIMNMSKVESNFEKIYISTKTFRETLFHEYFHYIFNSFIKDNNISDKNMPLWFEEGIAEYMVHGINFDNKELDFVPLNKLTNNNEWIESSNSDDNINPYIQSHFSIYKIITLYNKNTLKEIILNCKDKSFDESFEEITNLSLNEFEKNLKDDFKSRNSIQNVSNNLIDSSELDNIKIKCLENYIKLNENDIRAYETLSMLYSSNFDKAVTFLKESIKKLPKEPILWRHLSIIYEDNNMLALSKECFNKANELDKK